MQNIHFYGTFDGEGHTISNLTIDNNSEYQGLFGYSKGTIKNIGVDGNEINLNKETGVTAGVIAGCNEGVIESCYNKANITSKNVDNLGGIAGIIKEGGKISKCYNTGKIIGSARTQEGGNTCGICGMSFDGTIIESCYNSGNITVTTNFFNCRVGGITMSEKMKIYSCYNSGDLKLTDTSGQNLSCQAIAGICAQSDAVEISNCYNIGKVELIGSTNYRRDASILGGTYYSCSAVVKNCYMCDNLNLTYRINDEGRRHSEKIYKMLLLLKKI